MKLSINTIYDLYGHSQAQDPLPLWVMKFTIPSHHYNILNLFDLCPREEDFERNNVFSLHGPRISTRTPGVMKLTILIDLTSVITTVYSLCLIYAQEREEF